MRSVVDFHEEWYCQSSLNRLLFTLTIIAPELRDPPRSRPRPELSRLVSNTVEAEIPAEAMVVVVVVEVMFILLNAGVVPTSGSRSADSEALLTVDAETKDDPPIESRIGRIGRLLQSSRALTPSVAGLAGSRGDGDNDVKDEFVVVVDDVDDDPDSLHATKSDSVHIVSNP
jgi:hypothetical protein